MLKQFLFVSLLGITVITTGCEVLADDTLQGESENIGQQEQVAGGDDSIDDNQNDVNEGLTVSENSDLSDDLSEEDQEEACQNAHDSIYAYEDSVRFTNQWTPKDDEDMIFGPNYDVLIEQIKDKPTLVSKAHSGGCYGWCPNTSTKVYDDGLVVYHHADYNGEPLDVAYYVSEDSIVKIKELMANYNLNEIQSDTVYIMGPMDVGNDYFQYGNGVVVARLEFGPFFYAEERGVTTPNDVEGEYNYETINYSIAIRDNINLARIPAPKNPHDPVFFTTPEVCLYGIVSEK